MIIKKVKNEKSILFKAFIVLVTAPLIFQLSACGSQNNIEVKEDDKMKGELSVYYVDYEDKDANNDYTYPLTLLLEDFINTFTDVNIVSTTFTNGDSFMTQVATELSVGKGPDLFLLDYATKMNWVKLSKMGSYENLSPFIEKDDSFDVENYYVPVIKAGQVDNKQYVLPLGYNCMSLHTGEKKLGDSNIKINTINSYEDVLTALTEAIKLADNNSKIIPVALSFDRNDFLSCFMEAFGTPVIDYEKNTPALDKESLLSICDFLKILYPYSETAFSEKYENSFTTQNAQNVIFTISNREYVGELTVQSAMMKQIDDEPITIQMPRYDDPNQPTAQIFYYAAVNGNSKNKQLAYDSAKALMDLGEGKNINYKIPVNKNNLNHWINELEYSPMQTPIDNNLVVGDFDTEKTKNSIDAVRYVSLNDMTTMRIVNDGMAPYIEGDTKTFDECYDETVNKLNLYINE